MIKLDMRYYCAAENKCYKISKIVETVKTADYEYYQFQKKKCHKNNIIGIVVMSRINWLKKKKAK